MEESWKLAHPIVQFVKQTAKETSFAGWPTLTSMSQVQVVLCPSRWRKMMFILTRTNLNVPCTGGAVSKQVEENDVLIDLH